MYLKSSRLLFLIVLINFFACKKNNDVASGVFSEQLKDSTVSYTRDIYLWYDQIPSTFSGRNYSDPDKIMEAIRQYSMEPGFATPVDRWSFAVKKAEWDNISQGISADFGLGVFFYSTGDLRVKMVEKESPAGKAGIHRGWRITKINGSDNITTANTDFIVTNVFNSASTKFTFQKPDGTIADITLDAVTYNEHPVVLDSIYTINAKKIGYLVFNSFLGDTNEIKNEFARVFNRFAGQNISDIIVDLRYNGGGYVSLQEKLANYLVPAPPPGSLMMTQQYNAKYTQYNSSTLFNKAGALNLQRVLFIVTSGTASASELLINNLKPYMTVKLVGPQATHGKPVGFFAYPQGDWYVFPVSFRSTNKNGQGSYFSGFPLNSQVQDGLDKDWGNAEESCLARALTYLTTGSFGVEGDLNPRTTNQAEVNRSNLALSKYSFQGAIGNRIK